MLTQIIEENTTNEDQTVTPIKITDDISEERQQQSDLNKQENQKKQTKGTF